MSPGGASLRPWVLPGAAAQGALWWSSSALGLVSTPQRIVHFQTGDPAPMAEIFRVENGAAAADRGFGDQGIEPAELFPDRQRFRSLAPLPMLGASNA